MNLEMLENFRGWPLKGLGVLVKGEIYQVGDELASHLAEVHPDKCRLTDKGPTHEVELSEEGKAFVGRAIPKARKKRLELQAQLARAKTDLVDAEGKLEQERQALAQALLKSDSKKADTVRKRVGRASTKCEDLKALIMGLEGAIPEMMREEQQEELDLLAGEAPQVTEQGAKARGDFTNALITALEAGRELKRLQRRASHINSRMAQLSESLGVPCPPVANVQGLIKSDQVDFEKSLDSQIARLRKRWPA